MTPAIYFYLVLTSNISSPRNHRRHSRKRLCHTAQGVAHARRHGRQGIRKHLGNFTQGTLFYRAAQGIPHLAIIALLIHIPRVNGNRLGHLGCPSRPLPPHAALARATDVLAALLAEALLATGVLVDALLHGDNVDKGLS